MITSIFALLFSTNYPLPQKNTDSFVKPATHSIVVNDGDYKTPVNFSFGPTGN